MPKFKSVNILTSFLLQRSVFTSIEQGMFYVNGVRPLQLGGPAGWGGRGELGHLSGGPSCMFEQLTSPEWWARVHTHAHTAQLPTHLCELSCTSCKSARLSCDLVLNRPWPASQAATWRVGDPCSITRYIVSCPVLTSLALDTSEHLNIFSQGLYSCSASASLCIFFYCLFFYC